MHYLKNEQECFAEIETRGAVQSDVSLSSDCHRALHSAQGGLNRVACLSWLPVFWVGHNAGSLRRRRNLLQLVGSLRIDDFRTTPTLGHFIVRRCRPVENMNLRFVVKTMTLVRAAGKFSRRF